MHGLPVLHQQRSVSTLSHLLVLSHPAAELLAAQNPAEAFERPISAVGSEAFETKFLQYVSSHAAAARLIER